MILLGEGRTIKGLVVSLFAMDLWDNFFLSGDFISEWASSPGARLCLLDGAFNLDGVLPSSEPRTGDRDATDMSGFEGSRSCDTGWVYISLVLGAPDEALDGDLE